MKKRERLIGRIAEMILRLEAGKNQKKTLNALPVRFIAGGKPYFAESQLTAHRIDDTQPIFRDCYGRMVLRIDERYPTFDSYDALYEDRYFHYYYIETPEGFACVRTADDQDDSPVEEGISREELVHRCGTWHKKLLTAAGVMEEME